MRRELWLSLALCTASLTAAAYSFAQTAAPAGQAGPVGGASETDAENAAPVTTDPMAEPEAPLSLPGEAPTDWNPSAETVEGAGFPAEVSIAKPRKALRDVAGDEEIDLSEAVDPQSQEGVARDPRRTRRVDPVTKADLEKLSRIMGALHALRVSCSGREDQTYRSRMATLLDLEAADDSPLRDPLVDAFNAGFQAYGQGVATCPADQSKQEARLAKDGFKLAKQFAAQYRAINAQANQQPKPLSNP